MDACGGPSGTFNTVVSIFSYMFMVSTSACFRLRKGVSNEFITLDMSAHDVPIFHACVMAFAFCLPVGCNAIHMSDEIF